MNFKNLEEKSKPHYYSLTIDKFLPKKWRDILRYTSIIAAAISFFFSFNSLPLYFSGADGLFFLFLLLYLLFFLLEVFYRSMSNEGMKFVSNEDSQSKTTIDCALSRLIFDTNEIDVTRALFENKIGQEILARSGVSPTSIQNFILSDRAPIMASTFDFENNEVDLAHYIKTLLAKDRSLQYFLVGNRIDQEKLIEAARAVSEKYEKERYEERFWSRSNLLRIPSIAAAWFDD